MPTFAFPCCPEVLTLPIHPTGNAPLPILLWHVFGDILDARLLSVPAPLDQ